MGERASRVWPRQIPLTWLCSSMATTAIGPRELPILLAPIIEGRADITLGSRLQKLRSAWAMPWHQAFGNRLAASLIRLLYGVKISDLGPFRAARADALRALALEETTYGWAVEMILKGALAGFRVVEVPVSYHPRIGKSKISGTLKGTVGAAWFILSLIVRYYFRQSKSRDATASVGPGTTNHSHKKRSTRCVIRSKPRPQRWRGPEPPWAEDAPANRVRRRA